MAKPKSEVKYFLINVGENPGVEEFHHLNDVRVRLQNDTEYAARVHDGHTEDYVVFKGTRLSIKAVSRLDVTLVEE